MIVTQELNLIIHAPNVHQGGGRVLLTLMLAVIDSTIKASAMFDARFPLPDQDMHLGHIERVKPSLLARLWAEWKLYKLAQLTDVVLCFGNLPPIVFIQNRYLIDSVPLKEFTFKVRLRLILERLLFRLCGCASGRAGPRDEQSSEGSTSTVSCNQYRSHAQSCPSDSQRL